MEQTHVQRTVPVLKADSAKQIVYGEVYVPDTRDSHGHFMTALEIEKMSHGFMAGFMKEAGGRIDTRHDFQSNGAYPVESFIARQGDPDFTPGAWVLGVHVPDPEIWAQIEKGELAAFSLAGDAELIPDQKGGE